MIALERETMQVMLAGQHRAPALASPSIRDAIAHDYPQLN
jgi:hypothetical protein